MTSKTYGQQVLEGAKLHLKRLRSEAGGRGEKMQYDDLDLMIEVDRILRERAARKGGLASKKAQGIMLALQCAPNKNPKIAWRHFKQFTPENPFKVAGYSVYVNDERLIEISPAGKKRAIKLDTFRGYFSKP